MALSEDDLDNLRSEMLSYMDAHGLPTDRDALAWFQEAAREGTTPEQAFAPLYESYFAGSGGMFDVQQWMLWTTNIDKDSITLRPDKGGGVYFNFDFDFESDDGEYSGARGAHGTV